MLYDVVVVGAGVSGLYAAGTLRSRGFSVLVIEASDYIGGRIKQVRAAKNYFEYPSDRFKNLNFSDWPVDLGAEIVHGKNTLLWNIIKENNWKINKVFHSIPNKAEWSGEYFWISSESRMYRYDTLDKEICNLLEVMANLVDAEELKENMTLYAYLAQKGVSQRVIGLADALWGKYYGSQIDRIGYNELISELKSLIPTSDGHLNYRLQNSFSILIDHLKQNLDVLLSWCVEKIEYHGNIVKLISTSGLIVEGKKVVLSVPLTVLRDEDIEFDPPLPPYIPKAAKKLRMDSACKIICKFSRSFWPSDMQLLICGNCSIPEIWFDERRGSDGHCIVVGFITGSESKFLLNLDDGECTDKMISQMNHIFSTCSEPAPASACFISSLVFNWTKQSFIKGGYSCIGTDSINCRQKLNRPIQQKLFFCGEATCVTTDPGTVNGALVSGLDAADQISSLL